jgi:alginate O-acetyltransferase complex protein AlgI
VLFSSFLFLFGFLPAALTLTYGVGRSQLLAKITLTLLSLGFYAWWRPIQLPILLFSIVFNFFVGAFIQKNYEQSRKLAVSSWLAVGVTVDLAMLGWFKYANFGADNLSLLTGLNFSLPHIALPLAISFFTFQKIAYLIDSARGEAKRISFLDFSLFAAFFPQLIAGPIVHYKEIVPQIRSRRFGVLIWRNVLVGLVMLSIGLFKKTVIADTLATYVNPLFAEAGDAGHKYSFATAWLAATTYTFQLYFDFSGYSDMAIGLARMFGVKLPLNFHSPLRAASIIDYWRRWHMTLQRFIVAYVFQPLALGLNRRAARAGLGGWWGFAVGVGIPTLVTFVAVGAWHGAGWTFVLFGVMHALYVTVNEIWRERRVRLRRAYRRAGRVLSGPGWGERLGYHALTLAAVAFANVLFRAHTFGQAVSVWSGMVSVNLEDLAAPRLGWGLTATLVLSMILVFLMPNTQQIMGRFDPAYNWDDWRDVARAPVSWTWKPSLPGLFFAGAVLFLGVMFIQRGQAVFLYFNF